jgi:hypothetical protein
MSAGEAKILRHLEKFSRPRPIHRILVYAFVHLSTEVADVSLELFSSMIFHALFLQVLCKLSLFPGSFDFDAVSKICSNSTT